uniref:Uncharacterized protein n=1 Tax=Arundo donax TaxID=35708 RepID=A0A0A9ARS9_ARUDO
MGTWAQVRRSWMAIHCPGSRQEDGAIQLKDHLIRTSGDCHGGQVLQPLSQEAYLGQRSRVGQLVQLLALHQGIQLIR